MTTKRLALLIIMVLLLGIGLALFAPLLTYREVESPDGKFRAVARTSLIGTLIPVMPGQGGDKAGRITLYRVADGKNCGSLPVEMLAMISDIRWWPEDKPTEADLVATGAWNLDACSVDSYGD